VAHHLRIGCFEVGIRSVVRPILQGRLTGGCYPLSGITVQLLLQNGGTYVIYKNKPSSLNVATMKIMKDEPTSGQLREVLGSAGKSRAKAILTDKELKVLELVSYGYDNRAIAEQFQVTLQAVKNMLRGTCLKLGADNRAHAVAVCFRNGWLSARGEGAPVPEAQQGGSAFTKLTHCTRRWNNDGTIYSVCNDCGLTIARAFRAADLALVESRHKCQVLERRRAIRIVSRNGLSLDDRRNARSPSLS
jgi:DNA-binding CsgD family transcriptional regulator